MYSFSESQILMWQIRFDYSSRVSYLNASVDKNRRLETGSAVYGAHEEESRSMQTCSGIPLAGTDNISLQLESASFCQACECVCDARVL